MPDDFLSTLIDDGEDTLDTRITLHEEFPTVIDNTMISCYRGCERKFWLEFIYGLRPVRPSIHLHAGGVYARGLEDLRKAYYGDGVPLSDALQAAFTGATEEWGDKQWPTDSVKSFPRIIEAIVAYSQEYPLDTDILKPHMTALGPSVEFTFAIPIPDTAHPITGEPLLYGGRFDMLANYRDEMLVVHDDKTCSALGAQWAKQWRLRSQFTGYMWAARMYGFDVTATTVRGCALLRSSIKFGDAITYRPQWMIDEWLEGMILTAKEMTAKWERHSDPTLRERQYAKQFGDTCSHYGGCAFLDLCDKEVWKQWVEGNYIETRWNPTAKDPEVRVVGDSPDGTPS